MLAIGELVDNQEFNGASMKLTVSAPPDDLLEIKWETYQVSHTAALTAVPRCRWTENKQAIQS
jgi:hypothetical protein